MHDCGGIHRLAVAKSGLETHLVGSCHSSFIQPVAQAADDTVDVQLSIGPKHHFEQNFSLQPQLAGFIGISRIWLESDFHRIGRRTRIRKLGLWSSVRQLLLPERAGRDCVAAPVAAAIAVAASGYAVAESGAGDRAFQSLGSARAIAISRPLRQVKGTEWLQPPDARPACLRP